MHVDGLLNCLLALRLALFLLLAEAVVDKLDIICANAIELRLPEAARRAAEDTQEAEPHQSEHGGRRGSHSGDRGELAHAQIGGDSLDGAVGTGKDQMGPAN